MWLVVKELRLYLADRRFVGAMVFCGILSLAGVSVGIGHFVRDREQYRLQSDLRDEGLARGIEDDCLDCLRDAGVGWNRPPEVLRPWVAGLSDAEGRLATARRMPPQFYIDQHPHFQESLYEQHPAIALFGVLDLNAVVTIILSLLALAFSHDAICGEKERGTLSLLASFPVSRARLAAAKLIGFSVAVLLPYLFSLLLAALPMSLSSDLDLAFVDGARMLAIGLAFGLYIAVFGAFGLWVSALIHKRSMSLLVLLALWTVWVFLLPAAALRVSRFIHPAPPIYELDRASEAIRWDTAQGAFEEREAYFRKSLSDSIRNPGPEGNAYWWWDHRFDEPNLASDARWREQQEARLSALVEGRRGALNRQFEWAFYLGAVSPLSSVEYLAMDLARTGWRQQSRIEAAFNSFYHDYKRYIWAKEMDRWRSPSVPVDLADFVAFHPPPDESLADVLERNLFQVLCLVFYTVIGYAGAYMAMVRYDVR